MKHLNDDMRDNDAQRFRLMKGDDAKAKETQEDTYDLPQFVLNEFRINCN
jgi:hypothetical protein